MKLTLDEEMFMFRMDMLMDAFNNYHKFYPQKFIKNLDVEELDSVLYYSTYILSKKNETRTIERKGRLK